MKRAFPVLLGVAVEVVVDVKVVGVGRIKQSQPWVKQLNKVKYS
jgi:hypothetical protein